MQIGQGKTNIRFRPAARCIRHIGSESSSFFTHLYSLYSFLCWLVSSFGASSYYCKTWGERMIWLGLAAGLAAVWLLLRMNSEARTAAVNFRTITLNRLPKEWDGTQICFVTDIHRRALPDALIQQIRSAGAEFVFVGGDFAERGVSASRIYRNASLLRSIAPVYFVRGNHDYDLDASRLDDILLSCGIRILDNKAVRLERGQAPVWLVGLDDPVTDRDCPQLAYEGVPHREHCTLLLAHAPSVVHRLGDYCADLVLSGHTHGGQICPPYLGPIYLRAQQNRFISGLYRLNRLTKHGPVVTRCFVSRGFGTSRWPLRWNCPPEIHHITLLSATS